MYLSMSKYYRMTKDQIESDGQKIDLYILKPVKNKKPQEQTPGILWIHGGGYVTGMAKMIYISRAMNLVKKYGINIKVSPGIKPMITLEIASTNEKKILKGVTECLKFLS